MHPTVMQITRATTNCYRGTYIYRYRRCTEVSVGEAIKMVRKQTCPHCKGDRYVKVLTKTGSVSHIRCPHCGGTGFQVTIVRA